ncbi:GNAT family N-acetyltransferase [Catenuloplanes atrovinosus]|uniref:GNAT superfamily N-acetyltransferase n=1 Tax=Catenuloplanes atrovinosus TaxID=137266 RepID=A0AAE4CDE1_9ACTN|nr:GNAT family N-acetyltransferase [Catenuloplanes atrovinosus]MDR7278954.1 GNAT superfamily N-acetyltransferase [Catenuloplanes atrovinosus]
MIIARAGLSDIDTIMSWRRERTAWLAARGEDQWSVPLPRRAVAATVSAGQTWMVWDGHTPAATITLAAATDAEGLWKPAHDAPDPLWYPEDDPADALYAAKMMVPRDRSGSGLGQELLDWAGGRAFAAGLTWLRLDAWTSNTRLHDYYRRQGFQHVRTVESRLSGACFQRAAQPYDGLLKTEGG